MKGILPEDLQLVGSPVRGFCGSLSYEESVAGGDVPETCQSSVFPLSPGMPHLRSWWDLRPALNYMRRLLWYPSLQGLRRVLFNISTQSFGFSSPVRQTDRPIPQSTLLKIIYLQLLDRPPGMATQAVLFFSYIGGHCQTRSITPSVMQTVPSSTSPNRLVQGEARPTQASLWSEPSRGPALFALLTSRELPLPGSRAASWADQGASALVLLWWLEKCGFCFLRST